MIVKTFPLYTWKSLHDHAGRGGGRGLGCAIRRSGGRRRFRRDGRISLACGWRRFRACVH